MNERTSLASCFLILSRAILSLVSLSILFFSRCGECHEELDLRYAVNIIVYTAVI